MIPLLLALFAQAQVTIPPAPTISIYVNYKLFAGDVWHWTPVVLDPPASITIDPAGVAHLTIPPPAAGPPGPAGPAGTITPGPGLIDITVPGGQQTLALDGTIVPYRVAVPLQSGICDAGTGAWAADASWFYFCVVSPNATPNNDTAAIMVWARIAVGATQW